MKKLTIPSFFTFHETLPTYISLRYHRRNWFDSLTMLGGDNHQWVLIITDYDHIGIMRNLYFLFSYHHKSCHS